MSDNVILKAFEADWFEPDNLLDDRAEWAQLYIDALEGDPEMADGETTGIIRDALGSPEGRHDIDRFLHWEEREITEALAELRKIAGA